MLRAMQKKTGTKLPSQEAERFFLDHSGSLSGADVEAVLTRARMRAVLENNAAINLDDLKSALEDFIPPSYPTEIEMQNLAAVLECTGQQPAARQIQGHGPRGSDPPGEGAQSC